MWAQALTFDTARAEVALNANGRQDFTLRPMANFVKQLPGDVLLAALPQTTPEDARMHRIVRNNCTGCHSASYVLQHRFDEDGWRKVIATMKNINGAGVDQRAAKRRAERRARRQRERACRLSRARPRPGRKLDEFRHHARAPVAAKRHARCSANTTCRSTPRSATTR